MKQIKLNNNLPGISGLLAHRKITGDILRDLAQALLVDKTEDSLTTGEKELIAAFVSAKNNCEFCWKSHGAIAARYLGTSVVSDILSHVRMSNATGTKDYDLAAKYGEKIDCLLNIAGYVTSNFEMNTANRPVKIVISEALDSGLVTEEDVHTTVLIASAFNMYNRYVHALAQNIPTEDGAYAAIADRVVSEGYIRK